MSRKTPKLPPQVERRQDGMIRETRRYKLITPLFGGGVEAQKADPVTVVRGTEVRGHLRFWWRATRGGQPKFNGELAKMKAEEERIWGSAAGKDRPGQSLVSVFISESVSGQELSQVPVRRRGKMVNVDIGDPSSPYSYVTFPLRKDRNKPAGKLREGVEFTLELAYTEYVNSTNDNRLNVKEEVEAAIWAWETFGGIGARTRRGFGALHLARLDGVEVSKPDEAEVHQQIIDGLNRYVVEGEWPINVPHLNRKLNLKVLQYETEKNEKDVWDDLISALSEFRQAPEGRPKGTKASNWRPGRSYWPEPDEVRRRAGTHKPGHVPIHPVRKFPRAAFGLPIIFEFKYGDVPPEPEKTTLQGADHDRLASPLILRPIACANDRAVGIAAILDAPIKPPGGWLLKGAPINPGDPPIEVKLVSKNEADAIQPLKNNRSETDVLLAFLNSL